MFYEKLIWMMVAEDGYPPCDSETLFVGMNSAGYCGCFNEHGLMSTRQGQRSVCLYATAEGCDEVMTDLAWWAKLETPNDRVEGRDAALSRRVPSHDGLCGNGNYNERTDK